VREATDFSGDGSDTDTIAGQAQQKETAGTRLAGDVVDAALAGLDLGETVTIPS